MTIIKAAGHRYAEYLALMDVDIATTGTNVFVTNIPLIATLIKPAYRRIAPDFVEMPALEVGSAMMMTSVFAVKVLLT